MFPCSNPLNDLIIHYCICFCFIAVPPEIDDLKTSSDVHVNEGDEAKLGSDFVKKKLLNFLRYSLVREFDTMETVGRDRGA